MVITDELVTYLEALGRIKLPEESRAKAQKLLRGKGQAERPDVCHDKALLAATAPPARGARRDSIR